MKSIGQKDTLAILGGTFDPPHKAHLTIALEACEKAKINNITLIPCRIPALKSSPSVTAQHRLNMLELASRRYPQIRIDDRELLSNTTSYTVNTLEALKTEMPDSKLFFIIGTDNLLTFEKWHRWQDILGSCHLIVCRRSSKGNISDSAIDTLNNNIKNRIIRDIKQSHHSSAGTIYLADTTLSDISSTDIRRALEEGHDVSKWLEPEVYKYIKQHRLYRQAHNTC
jgi:nicotinate-nucleotide adenylyltransferase